MRSDSKTCFDKDSIPVSERKYNISYHDIIFGASKWDEQKLIALINEEIENYRKFNCKIFNKHGAWYACISYMKSSFIDSYFLYLQLLYNQNGVIFDFTFINQNNAVVICKLSNNKHKGLWHVG